MPHSPAIEQERIVSLSVMSLAYKCGREKNGKCLNVFVIVDSFYFSTGLGTAEEQGPPVVKHAMGGKQWVTEHRRTNACNACVYYTKCHVKYASP